MDNFKRLQDMLIDNGSKIVLLVMDGLGGLPLEPGGKTELETAKTPNMDALTGQAALGLSTVVAPGYSPGSGPGHLALFGYDPLIYDIGRGVLEAMGIGFHLEPQDVAIRCNFCTVDEDGLITDRRAGRIPTEECVKRVEILREINVPGVEVFVEPVKEYRFVLVLRGDGLSGDIEDTDPQQTGVPIKPITATSEGAKKTAEVLKTWSVEANKRLVDYPPANSFTLRGVAMDPGLPKFPDIYGVRAGAVAVYPMYKGVSRLVGMDVIAHDGETPAEEFEVVKKHWNDYDFFFVHVKKTDSYGEDGNFAAKVGVIESVDQALPTLLELNPDVLIITGDHATPAKVKRHSWHPVPVMLVSENAFFGHPGDFGETACVAGTLNPLKHTDLMPLALAHSMRLSKYGA